MAVSSFLQILCNICAQFTVYIKLLSRPVAVIVQYKKYPVRENVVGFVIKNMNKYYKYNFNIFPVINNMKKKLIMASNYLIPTL